MVVKSCKIAACGPHAWRAMLLWFACTTLYDAGYELLVCQLPNSFRAHVWIASFIFTRICNPNRWIRMRAEDIIYSNKRFNCCTWIFCIHTAAYCPAHSDRTLMYSSISTGFKYVLRLTTVWIPRRWTVQVSPNLSCWRKKCNGLGMWSDRWF
jgi:hypothetical protein